MQIKVLTTIFLSMLVLLGYSLILFTIVKTEWRMLGDKSWREEISFKDEEHEEKLPAWQEVDHAIPFAIMAFLYCVMHLLNYDPNFYIYSMLAIIVLIQFLGVARTKTDEDSGKLVKWLAKCFDCIVLNCRDTGIRGYVFLIVCVIMGYVDAMFFTLLLFDVFHIMWSLTMIMRAISERTSALVRMLYLFGISMVVFAVFGQRLFTKQFIPDDKDELAHRHEGDDEFEYKDKENWECDTAVSCLLYITYKGLPAGDISSLMTEMGSDSNYVNYRSRIAYDLFFFLWIGILLFNIVTGLIIDSFAERREEDESRKRIMATECFICGIKNEDYDHEMLPPGSASFRKHCDEEHNQWMYLLFVQYLRNKPACDYDGIEMFVSYQLDNSALDWIPRQTSYAIDVAQKKGAESDGKGVHLEMKETIAALEASQRLMMKKIQELQSDVKAAMSSG